MLSALELSALQTECKGGSCMTFLPQNSKRKPESIIYAVAVVENMTVPVVGDTILGVLSTKDNYASLILPWVRQQQFTCAGGGRGGKKVTFIPRKRVLGKRPTKNIVQAASSLDGTRAANVGVAMETEYTFGDAYWNLCSLNGWLFDSDSTRFTMINFLSTAIEVLRPEDSYLNTFIDAGDNISGTSDPLEGMFKVATEGDRMRCYDFVSEDSLSSYKEELFKFTKFTFTQAGGTVTGLTVNPCVGSCWQYETTVGTGFSFTFPPAEQGSCLTWALFKDCKDDVPAAEGILIDTQSGEVEAANGLATVGKYKYTVVVQNECCVIGEYCIEITVKP